MLIYRTLANPAYLDLSIDPSNRRMGSIFSPGDPIIGNYGPLGLARVMTPRAWLSTWSGLSSQADLPDTIAGVTVPTLIVYADGDSDIFPAEQQELLAKSGAADKTLVELSHADHYLQPGRRGRREAARTRGSGCWTSSCRGSRSGSGSREGATHHGADYALLIAGTRRNCALTSVVPTEFAQPEHRRRPRGQTMPIMPTWGRAGCFADCCR